MSQQTNASPIAIGLVTTELALQAADSGQTASPPTSIKLTPRGRQTTRDGRSLDFDPEGLAARFKADGIAIPIDTDHSTVLRGGRGDTPNTVGYVNAVEPREDGLHGTAEWLDGGKSVLAARTHRFVSPSVAHDATGKTTWLHSVALVSAPAIAMPALAAAEGTAAVVATLGAVAVALGLTTAADQTAMLAAIEELKAGAVPSALHKQTLVALTTANDRLATLAAKARENDVKEMIADALKATKILPFEAEHYVALCTTEGGFQNVRTILANALPRLPPSGLDGRRLPTDIAPDPRGLAKRATAYREEQARKGTAVSWGEAVRFVEANPA